MIRKVHSKMDKKKKEGSIIIGLMILVLIVITMFVFAYEVAILFIAKEKNDSIAKNMSSSLILNIDEYKARQGVIDIDRSRGEYIVKKIKEESYPKELSIFDSPLVDIDYSNNSPNEIKVTIITELPLKDDLVFFKDISIKSKSEHIAYSKIDLSMLEPEMLEQMAWEDIWDLIIIEEVF